MRNWNASLFEPLVLWILLPDYLWGIETIVGVVCNLLCCRFQTTYEELKPAPASIFDASTELLPDYLWGIETKKSVPMTMKRQSGFQTTYEELKQSLGTKEIIEPIASRLPMRNWNPVLLYLYTSRRASRLPMRNWNLDQLAITRADLASRLPMRNWNPFSYSHFARLEAASRLPMRNWNNRNTMRTGFILRTLASRLPMRNWNLGSVWDGWASKSASRLPMRNWNATASLSSMRNQRASRLPMRNWNPVDNSWAILSATASRLPMRNWNRICSSISTAPTTRLPDYLWGIET